MLLALSCKPVEENSDVKAFSPVKKSAFIASKVWLECKIACARIENNAVKLVKIGKGTVAVPQITFADATILWKLSDYFNKSPDVAVSSTKDAGTQTPVLDTKADTNSKASFFSKNIAIDATGIHVSSSRNIRDDLKAEQTRIDNLQVADAKKEESVAAKFWDTSAPEGTKYLKDDVAKYKSRLTHLQIIKASTLALKSATKLNNFKPAGPKGFSAALKRFKAAEKFRFSFNTEAKVTKTAIVAESWVGGKILGKSIGSAAKYAQLIGKLTTAKPATPKDLPGSVEMRFFGTKVAGLSRANIPAGERVELPLIFPEIPAASVPVFGFPWSGFVVKVNIVMKIGIGFDVDVNRGGKVTKGTISTLTYNPKFAVEVSTSLEGEIAVLGIGVGGNVTALVVETPLAISVGSDPKANAYTLVNFTPVHVSLGGGASIEVFAKLEIPGPLKYLFFVGSEKTIMKAWFTKIKWESSANGHILKWVLWEPEFKMTIASVAPVAVAEVKVGTPANCAGFGQVVKEHVTANRSETDKVASTVIKALEKEVETSLNALQTQITKKCAGGSTGSTGTTGTTGTTPTKPATTPTKSGKK